MLAEVEPALELQEFLIQATLLANGGKERGGLAKNPLTAIIDIAFLARRYRETVRFTSKLAPPRALQPAVFGFLVWLADHLPVEVSSYLRRD